MHVQRFFLSIFLSVPFQRRGGQRERPSHPSTSARGRQGSHFVRCCESSQYQLALPHDRMSDSQAARLPVVRDARAGTARPQTRSRPPCEPPVSRDRMPLTSSTGTSPPRPSTMLKASSTLLRRPASSKPSYRTRRFGTSLASGIRRGPPRSRPIQRIGCVPRVMAVSCGFPSSRQPAANARFRRSSREGRPRTDRLLA